MANINEKIYIGSVDTPTLSFDQTNIEDIVCNNSVNLIGDELASDVLEVNLFFDDTDKVLENTSYATPIYYFSNDALVGKYYIAQIERKGIKRYLIRATSLIGLIEKEEFYGGFYNGKQFKDVVDDILFTNGVNLTKYKLYNALAHPQYRDYTGNTAGTTYTQPVKVADYEASTSVYKNKMHLEFVIRGDNRGQAGAVESSGVIAGWVYGVGGYRVEARSIVSDGGNNSKYYIYVNHPGSDFYTFGSSYNCGAGSKFVVDCDPVAGNLFMSVDYIDADNSSVTGHEEVLRHPTFTFPNISGAMNYAFGANKGAVDDSARYTFQIEWDVYKIYDENDVLLIDALFATDETGTIHYVANTVNGEVVSVTSFDPIGETYGTVADFTRIERDRALSESIVYGTGITNLPVRGWLKKSTRREALHQLLFAENVAMLKSDDGKILFTKISSLQNGSILDDNLYDDSDEKSIAPAKKINVTEHSYETTDVESETIFDNSSSTIGSGEYIVEFDKAPIFGALTSDGITIIANNCNAALVTGKGTITGTPYRHSKNVIQYISGSYDGTDVSVSNVGLITSINSDNIMNKLKAYYSGQLKKITNSIKYNGERCGLKYLFKTLYNDANTAHLVKLKAQTSSFVRANCEFIAGYVPAESSGYSGFIIVPYGQTWYVPSEVRSSESHTVRINLIGKGSDGTNGSNGSSGQRGSSGEGALPGGNGGAGGAAGTGGLGGYIYSVTVDVTSVNKIVSSVTGDDTYARAYDDNDALVGTYNSHTGNRSDTGFMNVFTGIQYARRGRDGVPGGAGGKGGYCTLSGNVVTPIKGESGGDADTYSGGQSFDCIVTQSTSSWGGTSYEYNSFGGGGGAAYGNNGENAYLRDQSSYSTVGGDGANAIVPTNVYTEYGSGGFGGNGGGGGGGAGTRFVAFYGQSGYEYSTYYYLAGSYGTGSAGTSGIDGCLIIYY